jgi:hypothetical protein
VWGWVAGDDLRCLVETSQVALVRRNPASYQRDVRVVFLGALAERIVALAG